MFQEVNKPLNIEINNQIMSMLYHYRYNSSNWIRTGDGRNDGRLMSNWLLSTNTKRFMVLMTRLVTTPDYTDTDDEDKQILPYLKVNIGCFIDGVYYHDVTQTNNIGGRWISNEEGVGGNYTYLYYSYVVFDFTTANEVKNSITVTDLNKVPTKGLFSLSMEVSNDNDKWVSLVILPNNTNIRFISIGSGIDTTDMLPIINKSAIDTKTTTVIKDIILGKMVGYTRAVSNDFELDTEQLYPHNQYVPKNIVLPLSNIPYGLALETNNTLSILYNKMEQGLFDGVIDGCDKEGITFLPTFTSESITMLNTTRGHSFQMSERFNLIPSIFYFDGGFEYTMNEPDSFYYTFNNILLIEKRSNVYKITADSFFIDRDTPLVPPQFKSVSASYKPFDSCMVNLINSMYNRWYKPLEYTLKCKSTPYIHGVDAYIQDVITEIPNIMNLKCYMSDTSDSYDIEVSNWNSDTTHNIYIDFIF